jgi:hypothetical protein
MQTLNLKQEFVNYMKLNNNMRTILLMTVFAFSFLSCEKNKAEAEYLDACRVYTTSQTCDDCCKSNGWERGVYWQVGTVGCECFSGK